MKHKVKHIHFVGIGGSGMSGIAEVLVNLGYQVSGSDLSESPVTERLVDLGAMVYCGHDAQNVRGADAVVVSSAVSKNNPEILAARVNRIPVVPRAVMLAELMRLKQGIAIAGTHGKTTTTSLIASILAEANLDPTFVIGGRLNSAGANAKLGTGEFIVVEADESDASFLNLMPVLAVITNIDADHMETYGHDLAKLKQAFVEFTQRLPFYGVATVCIDDPCVREIIPFVSKPLITYGTDSNAQVRAVQIQAQAEKMYFVVQREKEQPLKISLNLPGVHNVRNALAAIAIATELGIPDEAIVSALEKFRGVGRRFQHHGLVPCKAGGHYLLVDDYGHHPAEMRATIEAVRGGYPEKRLLVVFQPHRYTRTRDCFEDFVHVLSTVDALILAEVYSAGESPIIAADGRSMARALRVAGQESLVFVEDLDSMAKAVEDMAQDGDMVLTLGAGSIGLLPNLLTVRAEGQFQ